MIAVCCFKFYKVSVARQETSRTADATKMIQSWDQVLKHPAVVKPGYRAIVPSHGWATLVHPASVPTQRATGAPDIKCTVQPGAGLDVVSVGEELTLVRYVRSVAPAYNDRIFGEIECQTGDEVVITTWSVGHMNDEYGAAVAEANRIKADMQKFR